MPKMTVAYIEKKFVRAIYAEFFNFFKFSLVLIFLLKISFAIIINILSSIDGVAFCRLKTRYDDKCFEKERKKASAVSNLYSNVFNGISFFL